MYDRTLWLDTQNVQYALYTTQEINDNLTSRIYNYNRQGGTGMKHQHIVNKVQEKLRTFSFPNWTIPILLFGLSVVAYALLIPWLKYYWDDIGIIWIFKNYGTDGLLAYNSTKRPLLGVLYTFFTPLIGTKPLAWHIIALLLRWLTGVAFWIVLRTAWPKRQQLAAWAAILFTVYPGFDQQAMAIIYGYYYAILIIFLLSLYLNILAIRRTEYFWPLMVLSLLLSFLNIATLEYFYTLELLRPVLVFIVYQQSSNSNIRKNLQRMLLITLPFMVILTAVTLWRSFSFEYQTYSYKLILLDIFKEDFWQGIKTLIYAVGHDSYTAFITAWVKPFKAIDPNGIAKVNLIRSWMLTIIVTIGSFLFMLFYAKQEKQSRSSKENSMILVVATVAMLLAGIPSQLIGYPVEISFPLSRLTLPYMFGVSLLLALILDCFHRFRIYSVLVLSILIGFAASMHFRISLDYRLDGESHERIMEQMSVRMPMLQPGTIVMANYLHTSHNSDNSLIGPLNYLYATSPVDETLDYLFVYPSEREGLNFVGYEPGQTYEYNFLVSKFIGNTSNVVTVYLHRNQCLRVLDPELDPNNILLDEYIRKAAALSNWDLIRFDREPNPLPVEIYGELDLSGWCMEYQKAAVAYQKGDWQNVIDIKDAAFAQGMKPKAPSEWIIFIESYVNLGNWQKAEEITHSVSAEDPYFNFMLCHVWERIRLDKEISIGKEDVIQRILASLQCSE